MALDHLAEHTEHALRVRHLLEHTDRLVQLDVVLAAREAPEHRVAEKAGFHRNGRGHTPKLYLLQSLDHLRPNEQAATSARQPPGSPVVNNLGSGALVGTARVEVGVLPQRLLIVGGACKILLQHVLSDPSQHALVNLH